MRPGRIPALLMARLRSFLDYLRFKASLRARIALDLAMTLAGLVLIAFDGHSTVDILGAVLTLIGAILLFRDLRQRSRRRLNVRATENHDFPRVAERARPPAGYRKAAFGWRWYVTSEEVNRLLDKADNPLILRPEKYEVPAQILDYLEQSVAQRAPDYNQDKVGLRTDLTPALLMQNAPLKVQHSDYFRGLATNEMVAKRIERCEDRRRRQKWTLDFPVCALAFDNDELTALSDSTFANNIGVTSLLITADHHIVLQDQGAQSVDPQCINLGSSGSLDLEDLYETQPGGRRLRTLQGALRRGMEREANEETSAAVGPGRSTTFLTGYARYLHRGGKPEFFGITRTVSRFDDLEAKPSELKFVHRIYAQAFDPTPAGLQGAIEALIGRCEGGPDQYSPSMAVGLHLARSHVERAGLDLSPPPGA